MNEESRLLSDRVRLLEEFTSDVEARLGKVERVMANLSDLDARLGDVERRLEEEERWRAEANDQ